jgi:hypothetical protein
MPQPLTPAAKKESAESRAAMFMVDQSRFVAV